MHQQWIKSNVVIYRKPLKCMFSKETSLFFINLLSVEVSIVDIKYFLMTSAKMTKNWPELCRNSFLNFIFIFTCLV